MKAERATAEIFELDDFRRKKALKEEITSLPATPVVFWVPVWVIMPQPFYPTF